MIRAFWMCVPLYFFIGSGLSWVVRQAFATKHPLIHKLKYYGLFGLLAAVYAWQVLYFAHQATVFQPYYHPWTRNQADVVMAEKLASLEATYESIVIGRFTGQPYVYLALVGLIQLEELQESYPLRLEPQYTIGKYTFNPDSCPLAEEENVLFVVREKCPLPAGFQVIEKAAYLDGNDGYVFTVYVDPDLNLPFRD